MYNTVLSAHSLYAYLLYFIKITNCSYSANSTVLSSHQPPPHFFHLSLTLFFSPTLSVWQNDPGLFSPTTYTYCHCHTEQHQFSLHRNISIPRQQTYMVPTPSLNAAHFPCSLSRHLRKSSFHITRIRCHQHSKRPLCPNRHVQKKKKRRQRVSSHGLKAHRKPPKRAVVMISTDTLLLFVWQYALRAIHCIPGMLFLFEPSVVLHSLQN